MVIEDTLAPTTEKGLLAAGSPGPQGRVRGWISRSGGGADGRVAGRRHVDRLRFGEPTGSPSGCWS
jgi:hypothetical protein